MGSLGGLDDDFNFFLPDTLLESDSNSDDEQNADTFGESADAADLPAGFMSSALPDSPPFLEEPQPQGLLGRLGLGLQGLTGATSQPSTFEQPAYMDPRFELPERGRVDQMFGETYDPYDESEEQLPPWMSETVKPPNPTAPSFRAPAPATSAPVFQSRRTQVASGIGSQARPQGSSSPPFGLAQRGGATGGAGTRASGSRGQTEQVNPKWQQQNGMWPNSAAGGRGGGAAPAKQTQQRQTMKATRADPDSSNGGFSVVDRGHGAQTAAEIKARMQPPVAGKPILDKKAKLREAKLAAEARQHAKNLEAARLKEEAKKMEEKKRLANARIAAAREEVNEPVFNASKNAERERERERQLEREREILEAQRQADMRLKIKKEKAKSASRSRAEEDGAGGSHDEGGTAGKLRQRRAGQKDGSDSTDDTEFPDGTLRRKDRHDGKRRNQTSSQKDAERKKNGQLRSPQAAAAATRQNERTGDTMPSNAHVKPSTPTTPTRSLTSAVLPPATAVISTGMQYIMQLSWWVSGVAVNLASLLFKFIMALQMSALNGLTADHHVAFCFSFLYSFPFLVSFFTPWAPPWAPVCLYYAFLVQLFCIQGRPNMVMISRRVLPLMFLMEGISHHSFVLDLNGSERLVWACFLSSIKTQSLKEEWCLLSLTAQVFLTFLMGWSMPVVQWLILVLGLSTITPDLGQYSAEFATGLDGCPGGGVSSGESGGSGGSYDVDGAIGGSSGAGMGHAGYMGTAEERRQMSHFAASQSGFSGSPDLPKKLVERRIKRGMPPKG